VQRIEFRRDPRNTSALSRCTFRLCYAGSDSSPEESVHDGQLVEYDEKVDPELKREKKAADTVSDHGRVNCQEAQCLPKVLGADS
jgi:hypothetical protein